jgi:ferredoxin-NADP reductase
MSRRQKAPATSTRRRRPRRAALRSADGAKRSALLSRLHRPVPSQRAGPAALRRSGRFMADVQTDLERRGVPAERIHTESFGPVG